MTAMNEICKVHGTQMEMRPVPISYGLPILDYDRKDARQRLFPNSRRFMLGGCVIGDDRESLELVCAKCREAEDDWERTRNQMEGRPEAEE